MPSAYSFDFTQGPGFWRSWMSPSLITGDAGAHDSYTRFQAPGTLDPNHIDGIGPIWLLSHLSIPAIGGTGPLNLTNAEISITIRTKDLEANGTGLYFWIIRVVPETNVVENYYYGLQSTNWAYTGCKLLDEAGEEWSTINFQLNPDLENWPQAGSQPGVQGDWADRYVEYELPGKLSYVDTTLHLVFVGDRADQGPTGFVDIANITITTTEPATPLDLELPDLFLFALEDMPLSCTLPNPIAGDPGEGEPPTAIYTLVDGSASGGTISLDPATGAYTFTPNANF